VHLKEITMTKLIILSLLATIALLYVASPKLTFKPFSLSFANGWYALGFMLIMIGIGLVRYQGYVEGKKKGIEMTFRFINGFKKDKQ
jgi:hydrogenase/urease accessory protein HupE